MQGLIAHCDTSIVSRFDLMNCTTPEGTNTFRPIPHRTLLLEAERAIREAGLTKVSEAHALSANGLRYFGVLEVRNGASQTDHALMVGLRNANDKSLRAGIAAGACVLVCDNLSFSGEVVVARKHTVHILDDLPALVDGAVEKIRTLHVRQDERFAAYKAGVLEKQVADAMMVEMLRQRIITATQLPRVLREWEEPSHEEFREGGMTGWRMFNAVTEVLKPKSHNQLNSLADKTQKLHHLLDNAIGLGPQIAQRVENEEPPEAVDEEMRDSVATGYLAERDKSGL
jgi:hypothetical protein